MATTKPRARAKVGSDKAAASPPSRVGLISFLQRLSLPRTILLISLFSFLAYANSLGGEFVFDDTEQIVENQNIRSWDNLAKAFTTHVWQFRERPGTLNLPAPLPYYRPLFTLMLTIEYHLFGLWPQGWHLTSLLLHVCCAIGVFFIIRQMSRQHVAALFASILFAVHPVHAESVSWISGMTDPLFGVFFLASLYLYLKSRAPGSAGLTDPKLLAISLGLFALSAFAKETALSLVLLIFGYELIEAVGSKTARLLTAAKRALPYAAVALIYLIPRYLVLGESMWKNPQAPDRPLAYTVLTLPFVISSYVAHLVWPTGLSVTYNTHFVTSVGSPSFLFPAAGLGLIATALFLYRRRISREVWQALLLIFVPLLPVLNLGQVSQEEYLVFDHYLYLSVAGFGYLVAVAISKLGGLDSAEGTHLGGLRRPEFAVVASILILGTSTVAAARENRPWSDSYALWSNVARVRPTYWAAHYNAGLALLDSKRFEEARPWVERAGALKPGEPNVADALGRAYDGMGDLSNAVISFKRAIEINPEMIESYNNLGTVYFKNRDYSRAEANFSAALRLNPQAPTSRYNLGLCFARQGRFNDAARELELVVQETPRDAEALYELGLAYERMGHAGDAVRVFQKAEVLAKSQELASRIDASLTRLNGDR